MNNENRATHEQLCEVWRQKVFETLVQKKRVELIAKQNLDKYNGVTNDLKMKYDESVKHLSMERDEANDKVQVLETKFMEQTNIANVAQQEKRNAEMKLAKRQ